MGTRHINPTALGTPTGYSHVTIAGPGRLVYASGQVARDPNGVLIGPGDLAAQTEQIYENLRTALAAAGADLADLVKVVTYVVDLTPEKADIVRSVRNRYMGNGPFPASTMVGVSSLVSTNLMIEIEATAMID